MEMTITPDDFFRLLPSALGGRQFTMSGNRIRAPAEHREIVVELSAPGMRKIGALALPTLQVTLSLLGGTQQEWAACQRQFDQAFHRGGG